jgi:hypothetical protein
MTTFGLSRTSLAARSVTNIVIEGEVLTALQESTVLDAIVGTLSFGISVARLTSPMSVPEAVGTRVGLEPVPPSLRTDQRHAIEHAIAALESQIRSRERG